MASLTKGLPRGHACEEAESTESEQQQSKHSRWRYTLILIAAFMINFTACGLLFGFGIYQALYETMVLEDGTPFTGASSAEIDLIGTLSISLMTIGAPFAVAWVKIFSPQAIVCAGGLLFGLACVLASFGKSLWHFQLSQGLLLGIGTCLSFMPSMTVAPSWFGKHRGLAMGLISAGTGIGGLVWAPVITVCIREMGFRNTLRLTGALGTALICASGSALSWEPSMAAHLREESSSTSQTNALFRIPFPPWKIAKQRRFIAQALGAAFQSAAYYTPVFFIASYAKTLGYTDTDGANFTGVSNACNAIGKIAIGFVADRFGRLNAFFFTTLISAFVTFGLWVSSTIVGMDNEATARSLFISFTALYGIFASAYISLFPPALVELFGAQELPRVIGFMYMMQGAAAVVGTPVAGVLVRGHGTVKDPDSYSSMAILVGALLLVATGAVAWVRIEVMCDRAGGKWQWKWKM
ncbi:monocarboxylate transporter [Ilyonectria robusta]|uniref:monocarboxylate transporter n=1 Tax=Ilyonectria robusta TaxID=1079257 RepID=UPI001E8ED9EE|nr:monocarboxylate transporter [Ilyonectria robusta]KAH8672195.1 monocarboxylate transporter [Ilyonectria robusta]